MLANFNSLMCYITIAKQSSYKLVFKAFQHFAKASLLIYKGFLIDLQLAYG